MKQITLLLIIAIVVLVGAETVKSQTRPPVTTVRQLYIEDTLRTAASYNRMSLIAPHRDSLDSNILWRLPRTAPTQEALIRVDSSGILRWFNSGAANQVLGWQGTPSVPTWITPTFRPAWLQAGNTITAAYNGVSGTGDRLGTTDARELTLIIDSFSVARFSPAVGADPPTSVVGHWRGSATGSGSSVLASLPNNRIENGSLSAIVGGDMHLLRDGRYSAIIAGHRDTLIASGRSAIAGGLDNYMENDSSSAIIGGTGNRIVGSSASDVIRFSSIIASRNSAITAASDTSAASVILASDSSRIDGASASLIGAGERHAILGPGDPAGVAILGGRLDSIMGPVTNVAIMAGEQNVIQAAIGNAIRDAAILGGRENRIVSTTSGNTSAVILAGIGNSLNASDAFVAAGIRNTVDAAGSRAPYIMAGIDNRVEGVVETTGILGGRRNRMTGNASAGMVSNSFILAGEDNVLESRYGRIDAAALLGGRNNVLRSQQSTIIVSRSSTIDSDSTHNVIIGGSANGITGQSYRSVIIGGTNDTIRNGRGSVIYGGSNLTLDGPLMIGFNAGPPVSVQDSGIAVFGNTTIHLRSSGAANVSPLVLAEPDWPTQTQSISITASTAATASYDMILPMSGPPVNNAVMVTDASGQLSWTDYPAADVYRARVAAPAAGGVQVIANAAVTADASITVSFEGAPDVQVHVVDRVPGVSFTVAYTAAPGAGTFLNYMIAP